MRFDFAADIEGVFEVELEGAREQIAELRVESRDDAPAGRPGCSSGAGAGLALPRRRRARPGRARRPADPGMALRLGGRRRLDRVVRRLAMLWRTRSWRTTTPSGPLPRALVVGPSSTARRRSPRALSASASCGRRSGAALRASSRPGQLRSHVHLRHLLGRARPGQRRSSGTSSGPSTPGARSAARRAGRLPALVGSACRRLSTTRAGSAAGRRPPACSASPGSSSSTGTATTRVARACGARLHGHHVGAIACFGTEAGSRAARRSRSTSTCSRASRRRPSKEGRLGLRRPLSGLTHSSSRCPGRSALLVVMIGNVMFDGASEGARGRRRAGHPGLLRSTAARASQLRWSSTFTVGLAIGLAIVAAIYAVGVAGVRRVDHRPPIDDRPVVRTHARPDRGCLRARALFLAPRLQRPGDRYLASDPLGKGLGPVRDRGRTRSTTALIGATGIWYVQVARAGRWARVRPGPLARSGTGPVRTGAVGDNVAVLDAGRHGRVHDDSASACSPRRTNDGQLERDDSRDEA